LRAGMRPASGARMKPFAKPPLIRLEELTAQDGHGAGAAAGKESGPGRKGRPWTAEEHLAFLQGLRALGKGNWKGISRLFLFGARTPTQVWCSSLRCAPAAVLQTGAVFLIRALESGWGQALTRAACLRRSQAMLRSTS